MVNLSKITTILSKTNHRLSNKINRSSLKVPISTVRSSPRQLARLNQLRLEINRILSPSLINMSNITKSKSRSLQSILLAIPYHFLSYPFSLPISIIHKILDIVINIFIFVEFGRVFGG